MHQIVSVDICPNDNLNHAIVVEYVFLGENESVDKAILAGIKMHVLNDEENSESKKLTLMNYAKKFTEILIQVKTHKFIIITIFGKKIIL